MSDDIQTRESEVKDEKTNEDRRNALRKLGRYAYAAPLMVSLLASKNAQAQFSPPPPP